MNEEVAREGGRQPGECHVLETKEESVSRGLIVFILVIGQVDEN